MKDPAIYVILSQTQTKFGRCIRKVAGQTYNHASIALDPGLEAVYGFARPSRYALLSGGLVREYRDRYTMGNGRPVPVAVYRLPVPPDQYRWAEETVEAMVDNPTYLYNLFSVLTFPILKGFSVRQAYSCIEFVAWLLGTLGYLGEGKAFCTYKPDDLTLLLSGYLVYRGDIRDCVPPLTDGRYFEPLTPSDLADGIRSLARITKRSIEAAVG
ncbi:MAG: hypothetical protein IKU62_02695 [Ruminiclostridium sp.]|nr:hypothetical protein [Ruminiclostridium sp.]